MRTMTATRRKFARRYSGCAAKITPDPATVPTTSANRRLDRRSGPKSEDPRENAIPAATADPATAQPNAQTTVKRQAPAPAGVAGSNRGKIPPDGGTARSVAVRNSLNAGLSTPV